jgi:hypothetical protein
VSKNVETGAAMMDQPADVPSGTPTRAPQAGRHNGYHSDDRTLQGTTARDKIALLKIHTAPADHQSAI